MENIPNDIIFQFSLNFPSSTLVNYCLSCKKLASILTDENFWKFRVTTLYPLQGKIDTWKNTYLVVSRKVYVFGCTCYDNLFSAGEYYRRASELTLIDPFKTKPVDAIKCGDDFTMIISEENIHTIGDDVLDDGIYGGFCPDTTHDYNKYFNEKITHVSRGYYMDGIYPYGHTAIIVKEQLYTFGYNFNGECGYVFQSKSYKPRLVNFFTGMKVTSVSCGRYHTAVVANDQLYTFGSSNDGALGRPQNYKDVVTIPVETSSMVSVPYIPTRVEEFRGMKVKMVSCGLRHTAVIADNKLYTFGFAYNGKAGYSPKLFEGLYDVVSVDCGPHHTAVIARQIV
jgi:hypothetical protein